MVDTKAVRLSRLMEDVRRFDNLMERAILLLSGLKSFESRAMITNVQQHLNTMGTNKLEKISDQPPVPMHGRGLLGLCKDLTSIVAVSSRPLYTELALVNDGRPGS